MHNSKYKSKEPPDEKEITDINSVPSSNKTSLRQKAEEIREENEASAFSHKLPNMHPPTNLADVDSPKLS